MKNAFIATTKELPDWFKLENYVKVMKFENESDRWHTELIIRLKLRDTLRVDKALNFQNHWSLLRSWNKIKLYGLLAFAEDDEIDNKVHEMLMTQQNAAPNNPPDEDIEGVCATIHTLTNFKAYGFWWFQSMKEKINFILILQKACRNQTL
jgi:hypothetical protein